MRDIVRGDWYKGRGVKLVTSFFLSNPIGSGALRYGYMKLEDFNKERCWLGFIDMDHLRLSWDHRFLMDTPKCTLSKTEYLQHGE